MDSIQAETLEKTIQFIKSKKFNFRRGDIEKYFTYITKVNSNLTLKFVSQEQWVKAVYLKNIYLLWNVLIDDEIDIDNNKNGIKSTLDYIKNLVDKVNVSPTDNIQFVINEFFSFADLASSETYNWMVFDLLEITKGFYYEYLINNNPFKANTLEYTHNSIMTASINVLLDIDSILGNIDNSSQNLLRQSYSYFAKAIKFASDIGSFKREVLNEKSLNILLIKAIEEGLIDWNIIKNDKVDLDSLKKEISHIKEEVKSEAFDSLHSGIKVIKRINNIDLEDFIFQVTDIVENYSQEKDNFYQD